tara:strand:- start:901 stop:1662 length:762 start_codon:yes stop_codon:yes gene_type:complete
MIVEWEDCEPTIDNFWKNVKTCDPLNNLKFAGSILFGYYKFEENFEKTPKDLELELRNHDLNMGLIADDYSDDNDVKKAIDENKIVLIKSKYLRLYKNINNIDEIDPEHISKYYVRISCRPRKYVIEETLKYSSSIEENLEKLDEAGEIVNINSDKSKLSNNDVMLDNKEIDLSKLIIECRKLMKVKKVELSKIFEDSYKQFPKATMAMHAMAHDGSPIMALVNEDKIVCPIGVKITMNNRGERTEEFVPLMR